MLPIDTGSAIPGAPPPPDCAAGLLRRSPLDALDAKVLLCHALAWRRTELITRAHEPLDRAASARFALLEQRRLAGEPVAQLVGEREFYGRPFAVTPAVLIPRPDTELLVELALSAIDAVRTQRGAAICEAATEIEAAPGRWATNGATGPPPLRILDLGTGSGAIALTLALERPALQLTATDRSADALALAQHNAKRLLPSPAGPGSPTLTHNTRITFLQGDWFDALAAIVPSETTLDAISDIPSSATIAQRYDMIVSNPPYIAAGDPHLEQGDLRFEPRGALTDEDDGLAAIRAIAAGAGRWLRPGAPLLIEHGYDQGGPVRRIFRDAGFEQVRTERDLGGCERVTLGYAANALENRCAS